MKIILVDPYLVRTFLVIIFLILIMVRTLENNYFLMRTKFFFNKSSSFFCQVFDCLSQKTISGLKLLRRLLAN